MKHASLVVATLAFASLAAVGRVHGQNGDGTVPAPVPRTAFDGPAMSFDFPGVEVGVAEYDEGPTGATIFYFPKGATGVVEVRGGWPGTVNTDGLRLGYEDTSLDAVTFAGGSYYGLSVSAGVADEIRLDRDRVAPIAGASPGRGGARGPAHVVSAIVYDLAQRFNTLAPDPALGRAAFRAKRTGSFPLGARGAGRMTSQGVGFGEREKGGQGGAFRQVGQTKIVAFAVLNGGSVVDRSGNVVVCNHPASVGRSAADHIRNLLQPQPQRVAAMGAEHDDDVPQGYSANTNLFLVVTNQKMTFAELQRLAVQVHTSLARAIQPFNTRGDGDVLYAASTQEIANPELGAGTLNLHAAEAAWDAVLAAVPPRPLRAANRPAQVDGATLDKYVGEYEFGPNARLQVRRDGARLVARATGQAIYAFGQNADSNLLAESSTIFYQDTRFEDRLQFVTDARGQVTGAIFNPGLHHILARRIR